MKFISARRLPRLALLLLAGLLATCAGGGPAVQTHLGDDGTVTERMTGNEIGLEGEGEYSDFAIGGEEQYISGEVRYCSLDAGRRLAPDGTVTWLLFFSYTGPQKLVIERRKSMEIVVNGEYTSVLTGQGSPERSEDQIEGTFTESYEYTIPKAVLSSITRASDVLVTVTGGEYTLRAYFTADNIARFRDFVEACTGDAP